MPDTPEATGKDLARLALARYKETAKTAPANRKRTVRRTRATRGDGRDPVGLGRVLERITVDHEWKVGVTDGSLLDRWAELCPQYANPGTVQPAAYDPETGRLDLRPASYAYATQLRMLGGALAKQINTKLGRDAVQRIRILNVGNTDSQAASTAQESTPCPAEAAAPIRTRDTASPGYHRALQAHLAHKAASGRSTDTQVQAAVDRQTRALTEPAWREPEEAFTDAVAELERVTTDQDPRAVAEAIRQAAIHQKQTGGKTIEPLFQRTA